jgi:hypothetical protein
MGGQDAGIRRDASSKKKIQCRKGSFSADTQDGSPSLMGGGELFSTVGREDEKILNKYTQVYPYRHDILTLREKFSLCALLIFLLTYGTMCSTSRKTPAGQ